MAPKGREGLELGQGPIGGPSEGARRVDGVGRGVRGETYRRGAEARSAVARVAQTRSTGRKAPAPSECPAEATTTDEGATTVAATPHPRPEASEKAASGATPLAVRLGDRLGLDGGDRCDLAARRRDAVELSGRQREVTRPNIGAYEDDSDCNRRQRKELFHRSRLSQTAICFNAPAAVSSTASWSSWFGRKSTDRRAPRARNGRIAPAVENSRMPASEPPRSGAGWRVAGLSPLLRAGRGDPGLGAS